MFEILNFFSLLIFISSIVIALMLFESPKHLCWIEVGIMYAASLSSGLWPERSLVSLVLISLTSIGLVWVDAQTWVIRLVCKCVSVHTLQACLSHQYICVCSKYYIVIIWLIQEMLIHLATYLLALQWSNSRKCMLGQEFWACTVLDVW